jgi:hypothetical protein
MKTTVVFRARDQKEQRTVRFTTDNAPALLVGDTFVLPLMINLGGAIVVSRNWHGQQLVLSCQVTQFLIAYLVEKATKMKCCVDDYELPDQDWAQPFEE